MDKKTDTTVETNDLLLFVDSIIHESIKPDIETDYMDLVFKLILFISVRAESVSKEDQDYNIVSTASARLGERSVECYHRICILYSKSFSNGEAGTNLDDLLARYNVLINWINSNFSYDTPLRKVLDHEVADNLEAFLHWVLVEAYKRSEDNQNPDDTFEPDNIKLIFENILRSVEGDGSRKEYIFRNALSIADGYASKVQQGDNSA